MSVKEVLLRVDEELGVEIIAKLVLPPLQKKDLNSLLKKGKEFRGMPYIFVEIAIQEGKDIVFFGDARVHEDLNSAVEKEIGDVSEWVKGQVYVDQNKKIHLIKLSGLHALENIEKREEKANLVINAINPDLLSPTTQIEYGWGSKSIYSSPEKRIVKSFDIYPWYNRK